MDRRLLQAVSPTPDPKFWYAEPLTLSLHVIRRFTRIRRRPAPACAVQRLPPPAWRRGPTWCSSGPKRCLPIASRHAADDNPVTSLSRRSPSAANSAAASRGGPAEGIARLPRLFPLEVGGTAPVARGTVSALHDCASRSTTVRRLIESRRVEIVLAGDADQGEQRVAAGVRQRLTMRCGCAVSLAAQTGQSEAIHSPEAWANRGGQIDHLGSAYRPRWFAPRRLVLALAPCGPRPARSTSGA